MDKKIIIAIISGVIATAAIIAIVFALTQANNQPVGTSDKTTQDDTTGQVSNTDNKENKRTDFEKGETMVIGKLRLKVLGVVRSYNSELRTPREGYELIKLTIDMENTGVTGLCMYQTQFDVNYGGEELSESAFLEKVTDRNGNEVDDGCLKPDKPIVREVTYEIPAGASNLKLQYEEAVIKGFDEEAQQANYERTTYTIKF